MKTGRAPKNHAARTPLFRAACVAVALGSVSLHGFAQSPPGLLTSDERAWLAAHGPLRYAPQTAAPPFGFVKADGQVAGLTADLLAGLARRFGVEIKPVLQGPWPAALDALRRGEIDFVPTVVRTAEREQLFQFVGPYHEAPNVVFVRRAAPQIKAVKDLAGRRVAVTRESSIHTWLRAAQPELVLAPVESAREGLLLLALEQVDGVAASLPVGRHFIAGTSLEGLRVLPDVLFISQHHLAVRKDNDRLASILRKGMDSLTASERQEILSRWTVPEMGPPPWRVPAWLWEGALAALAAVAVVIAWNFSLRRRLARQARHLREQMEQEAALERRCTELVENATDVVFTRDFEGNYTSINPAGERILGYSRAELLRMNVSQVVAPGHMDRVRRQEAALAEREFSIYEVQVRAKDGRLIWLEASMRVLLKDGRRIGIQGIARDITERKRAEQQVQESEMLYHSLVEQLPQAIFRLDRSGRITFSNSRHCQMLGRKPEEVLGKTDFDLFPRELAEKYWADDRRVMETGEPFETVDHVRMPDGREMFVHVLKSPLRDAGGQTIGMQCLFWDVTETKQAQDTVATERHLLRTLIDNLPDLIFTKDIEGRYVISNAAHLRYLGVATEAGLAGKTVFDMNPPELAKGYHEDDLRVLRDGETISNREELVRDQDGNRRWFLTIKAPLRNREGRITGMVAVCRNIDERKRAEEALRQSEETFSSIFQSSPTAMSLSTLRDARIVKVNAQFTAVTGYRQEDVAGKTSLDLGIWTDPEKRNQFWAQAQQAGRVVNVESDLRTKSGEVRHGLSSAEILTIGGEKYLLGIFHDITERKQAEDALRASRQLLSLHVEQTPLGVIEWDLDFRVATWNTAAERIFGFTAAEAKGRHAAELIVPPSIRPQVNHVWDALRAQRGGTRSTNQNVTKDGQTILCEWYNTPLIDASGRVIAVASLVQDVTEQHRIQEALRESEERYRLLAEHSDDFVSLHDGQGNRLYISPSYYRVTGWTPEEIRTTDYRTRMHPDDLGKVERAWAANYRGEANTIEHRIRCKDGAWIWVESRRKPILDPDGKVRQIVLWARDITERKHAEEARAQLEAQLRQAQKMEAVGQLAGGVAHDFNNILTVILGNAHLLTDDPSLSPPASEKIRLLIKSAERAATLIRQLLAFSRRQVMQMRRLDLNEVLSDVTQMLSHLIGEHIQLQCHYGPALPQIEADAGMMEQIIVNLAVNARDAMPHGGRLIISTQGETVSAGLARLASDTRAGRFVTLTITDTGCGMDQDTLSHLFEPFFTTKEVGKGTGLGLAMTYGIMKQHNGWIEATSRPNHGTTFKLFLPACAPVEPPASASPAPAASTSHRGSETILVVEDEEPVRQFIKGCLEQHGYRVLTAADADEALHVWESAGPTLDLLLTDIVMPGGLSGRNLADKLRKIRPNLKIILSSGYSREISTEPGDFPAWTCLPKPYDPVTLVQTVRRCLDAR